MGTCPTAPPQQRPRGAGVCYRLGCTGQRAEPRHVPPDTGVGRGGTAHPAHEQSPRPSQSVGMDTPALPNPTVPRRDTGDGSSHSQPPAHPRVGVCPLCCSPSGAELGPGEQRGTGGSGAGAGSRELSRAGSPAPAPHLAWLLASRSPGCSQPPASYTSHWGPAHTELHLGKAQAWECRRIPWRGMSCYPKPHPVKPHIRP